jgi:hypothetical protein
MTLKVKKLDKRMSGHNYFKYRVTFDGYRSLLRSDSIKRANRDFLNCTRYMTEKCGYGPELRLVHIVKEESGEVPVWATRHAYQALNSAAPDTIYLRDDEARDIFETFLTFLTLKEYDGKK